jgi:hypothetical protein
MDLSQEMNMSYTEMLLSVDTISPHLIQVYIKRKTTQKISTGWFACFLLKTNMPFM